MSTTIPPDQDRNHATVLADTYGDSLSELDDAEILDLFKTHGAVLFRGFSLDLPEFDAITSRFCSSFAFNESRGRKTVSSDGRTRTVNLGQEAFPLHAELSREPWKPDIAWFACATPPLCGGETIICDGRAVVAALGDETRQLLEDNRLEHKIPANPQDCERWLGVREPDAETLQRHAGTGPFEFSLVDGECFRTFYTPVLHRPMFLDEPVFANFLLFARYFHNNRTFPTFENGVEIPDELCMEIRQVADRLTVAVKWQQNDLIMLDNTRFMHGRNAVEDVDHRVILTQFGYANCAPLDDDTLRAEPWRRQAAPAEELRSAS